VRAEVVLSPKAWEDLEALIGYLEARSPATAERYAKEIPLRLEQLEEFPESGRFVPELLQQGRRRFREILFEHQRIIYRIDATRVTVVRIVDGRRLLSVETPL
jgi:toxin ParE1/3/4